MSEPGEPSQPNLHDLILEMSRRGHGSYVLVAATQLDAALKELLCLRMPKLSNTLREKFFDGYGPLSHFSTRIDLAFALGDIDDDTRHDLHVLRTLRNQFAHSTNFVHFDDGAMRRKLAEFRRYDSQMDRLAFFGKKIDEIWAGINQNRRKLTLADALLQYQSSTDEASTGKS